MAAIGLSLENILPRYCPLRTTKAMALVTDPTVCQRPGAQCHRPNYPSGTQWLQLPSSPRSFRLFPPFLELSQASRGHFLLSVGLLINISFLLFFAPVPLQLPITALTTRSDPTPAMAYPREGFEPREDRLWSWEREGASPGRKEATLVTCCAEHRESALITVTVPIIGWWS